MGGPSFDNDFIRRRRGAGSFVVLVIVVIFFTPLRRPWPPSTRAAAVRCDDLNNVHVDVPAGDDEVAAHLIAWTASDCRCTRRTCDIPGSPTRPL